MTPAGGPLQPGQRFAGCTIARRLGQGVGSTVYAANDEHTGALCAIKLLHTTPGTTHAVAAEAHARLLQEQALAGRLHHPGIVSIVGCGESAGFAWLKMELLPGSDLTRYTRPARRLPVPVVAHLGARIAAALAHAHAAGIVHRDLKPANVMVDWASQRVVITDFGLARSADSQSTRTGLVLGSPAYMAPELLAGLPPHAGSDLYALGVLLFQLLATRLPFEATGMGALLREVATVDAPDVRDHVPQPFDAVLTPLAAQVAALLQKAPAQRPSSAAAVAVALQGLAGDSALGPMSRASD